MNLRYNIVLCPVKSVCTFLFVVTSITVNKAKTAMYSNTQRLGHTFSLN